MKINPDGKTGTNERENEMKQLVNESEHIKVHESESDEQDKKIAETMLKVEEIEY